MSRHVGELWIHSGIIADRGLRSIVQHYIIVVRPTDVVLYHRPGCGCTDQYALMIRRTRIKTVIVICVVVHFVVFARENVNSRTPIVIVDVVVRYVVLTRAEKNPRRGVIVRAVPTDNGVIYAARALINMDAVT